MAKASLTLPDGTKVNIEGSAEEIEKIIALHRPNESTTPNIGEKPSFQKSKKRETAGSQNSKKGETASDSVNLSEIVNLIKTCNETENIENNILDRTSQVDRLLLPLYIVNKYVSSKPALTSGEISKIIGDLGISIFQPNVANTLSGAASKYVIGDKIRKRGKAVRYKISRRGEQYLKSVIDNKAD